MKKQLFGILLAIEILAAGGVHSSTSAVPGNPVPGINPQANPAQTSEKKLKLDSFGTKIAVNYECLDRAIIYLMNQALVCNIPAWSFLPLMNSG